MLVTSSQSTRSASRVPIYGNIKSVNSEYSIDLILAFLPNGAENTISIDFVVICAEFIMSLLMPVLMHKLSI